jgi:hypothetical protein
MKLSKHKLSVKLLSRGHSSPSPCAGRSPATPSGVTAFTRAETTDTALLQLKSSRVASYRYRALCKAQSACVVPRVTRPLEFVFAERRPLVPLPSVCLFLNKTAQQVRALIEEGKLAWAFDIRSSKAEHREARVLRKSLLEYTDRPPRLDDTPETESDCSKVIDLILPAGIILSPAAFQPSDPQSPGPGIRNLHHKMRLPASSFQELLFPQEPVLRGIDLARCFSCHTQHILNLIEDKSFKTVPVRHGPKASPIVTRSSVVEFLKTRRMS